MTTEEPLARALTELTAAIRQQTAIMEVLIEAMPAAEEARILGISERTVRHNREKRRMARLLKPS